MPVFKSADQQIGLALYTVRDDMNKDLEGTLTRVAEIGYNHLEAAGMVYYFVEQDTCRNHPCLESIKISYDCLRKMGF